MFEEVNPEDFMKIGGDKPSHLKIEVALIKMGGDGAKGGAFKKEILKMAGWSSGSLTTYASRSQVAADAFNRIREALKNASSIDDLKSYLMR
jgi:hypothetical protein